MEPDAWRDLMEQISKLYVPLHSIGPGIRIAVLEREVPKLRVEP